MRISQWTLTMFILNHCVSLLPYIHQHAYIWGKCSPSVTHTSMRKQHRKYRIIYTTLIQSYYWMIFIFFWLFGTWLSVNLSLSVSKPRQISQFIINENLALHESLFGIAGTVPNKKKKNIMEREFILFYTIHTHTHTWE